jgi:hypothetical protein
MNFETMKDIRRFMVANRVKRAAIEVFAWLVLVGLLWRALA